MESIDYLKGALGCVFAYIHSATKHFAGGVEHDHLYIVTAGKHLHPSRQFAKSRFVQQIVIGVIERQPGNGRFGAEPYVSKCFRICVGRSQAAEEFLRRGVFRRWRGTMLIVSQGNLDICCGLVAAAVTSPLPGS